MTATMMNGNARTAARQAWAESGGTITGTELAARFGKSERWGRMQIAAARQDGTVDVAEPAAPRPAVEAAKPAARPAPASATPRRRGSPPPLLVTGSVAAVAVVATVAAVVSYSHIRDLAVAAGAGWRADILPLSLDGMVAACTFCLVVDRRRGKIGHPLAWSGIALGLIGSVAANVLAVVPGLVGLELVAAVLAGFPPVALAMSAHLLVRILAER